MGRGDMGTAAQCGYQVRFCQMKTGRSLGAPAREPFSSVPVRQAIALRRSDAVLQVRRRARHNQIIEAEAELRHAGPGAVCRECAWPRRRLPLKAIPRRVMSAQ